ncbi:hypothetical protein [Streptomyces bluensis]|uniref:MaoC-like domain-containing protein n=1 Tax=Streptomyces bluensis TaxID=33897 RepID=A0ABW6UFS9_9ACTN
MSITHTSTTAWGSITVGDRSPTIELPIMYAKVAEHVYATRDWFPGHHNPGYAKAQGRKNIYANTMFFHGFLSRIVLGWVGPNWFEHKRSLVIARSVYPDDVLVGTGVVVAKERDGGWPPSPWTYRARWQMRSPSTGRSPWRCPSRPRRPPVTEPVRPLEGLKVVGVGVWHAGPAAGAVLADLGPETTSY